MEICLSISSTLAELTVMPVWKQLSYVIYYRRNISNVTSQMTRLRDKRCTIQEQVDAAEGNLERITAEVQRWLQDAEDTIKENEAYFTEERVSNARCLSGWCPNLKSRYYLGSKAKKMSVVVGNLLDQVGNFQTVSLPALPPGRVSVSIQHSEGSTIHEVGTSSMTSSLGSAHLIAFESRTSILEKVMHALKDDQANPIVISGMGGIGKTTMLNEVFERAKDKGLFNEVAMAVVTQKPNLFKIQDEIADFLGLKFLPRSLLARDKMLTRRLRESERVLVILDDVWKDSDLKGIGIPFCGNCKILIASRYQDIFSEMHTKRSFIVDLLKDEEAWCLFKKIAGDSIESQELRPLATQVLSKCYGLPIAICTVGKRLCGKSKGIWNDALRKLQTSSPSEVNTVVELSCKSLESEEAKSLLFLCSLYPEWHNIRVEDLVRHGLGLGLYTEIQSMEDGRNRVESLIYELKSYFLLLDSNRKGSVKMHDVIRDVAITMSSQQFENGSSVRHGVKLHGWHWMEGTHTRRYSYSSLVTNETHRDVASPTADYSIKPPEAIVEGMKKLKVLGFKRTRWLSILPSVRISENLQTLCLEDCVLGNVSIVGYLRTLMILSLRGSSINQLPVSFRNLANLWLLDLTGCKNLEKISSGVFSSLSKLQELYMRNCSIELAKRRIEKVSSNHYQLFGQVGEMITSDVPNEIVSELLSLCHLTTLEVDLPKESFESLQSSKLFDKLEQFKISIGCIESDVLYVESDDSHDVNSCHTILRLMLDGNSLVGSSIIKLPKKTEALELQMSDLADALNILDGECFSNLKCLKLVGCNSLEYIIDMASSVQRHTFPVLDSLIICKSNSMKRICNGMQAVGLFKELRRVKVRSCASLNSLFPFSVTRDLHQLEDLDIQDCPELKEIIELGEGDHAETKVPEVKLPNLMHLNLVNLPQLVGISRNVSVNITFPLLLSVTLQNLPRVISLCPQDSAPESSSSATTQHLFDTKDESFLELRFLKMINHGQITSIFSSCSVQKLKNLEHLMVRGCSSLKTLFDFEGLNFEVEHASAMFSCLEKMELISLPELETVWKPNLKIMAFQNLGRICIQGCTRLRSVFPSYIVLRSLQNLKHFKVEECDSLETLIEFKDLDIEAEHATFTLPCLEEIQLIKLPMLEYLWKPDLKIHAVFQNLRSLHIQHCNTLELVFSTGIPFQSLELLAVKDCSKVGTLFDFEGLDFEAEHASAMLSACIERIELISLPELEYVWKPNLKIRTFQNVGSLCIQGCARLRSVFPFNMQFMQSLQNLKNLRVEDCTSLETVVEFEDSDVEAEHASLALPCLEKMELIDLPMLKYLWKPHTKIRPFPNLGFLYIQLCRRLRSVFPHSMYMQIMQNLEHFKVESCRSLETVFEFEDSDVEAGKASLALPCLGKMELIDLPMLKYLYKPHQKVQVIFQSLRLLHIRLCKTLELVFPTGISFKCLELLKVELCFKLKTIFDFNGLDVEAEHASAVLSAGVEKIELISLPELESVWSPHVKITTVQNLGMLYIQGCNRLRTVFPFSTFMHSLQNLKHFKVEDCRSLETLIEIEDSNIEADHSSLILPCLEAIELIHLPMLKYLWKPHLKIQVIFQNMRLLQFQNCTTLEWVFPTGIRLKSLQLLKVEGCFNLKPLFDFEVLDFDAEHASAMFSCIEKIELISLPEMEFIWKPHMRTTAFQRLAFLRIQRCEGFKYVFPFNIADMLVNLKEFHISECKSTEDIICRDEGDGVHEHGTTRNKIAFSQVKAVEIKDLRNLVRFCTAASIIEWPSLTELVLSGLWKMNTFVANHPYDTTATQFPSHIFNEMVHFPILATLELHSMPHLENIWSRQLLSLSFCELRQLHVYACRKLLVVVPSYTQQRLLKLEELFVRDCDSLEEIIEFRDFSVDEDRDAFSASQIQELPLISQLQSSKTSYMNRRESPGFENLIKLEVSYCDSLRVLLSHSTARGLVKLKHLTVSRCKRIYQIISEPTSEGEESESMNILPQLTRLELSHLANLTRFSCGKYDVDWSNIAEVIFENCPKAETFCFGSVRTPKLEKVKLDCGNY